MHKKVKKDIDNLFKAYYNGFKQIVEPFKNLAEFRNGFSNPVEHYPFLILRRKSMLTKTHATFFIIGFMLYVLLMKMCIRDRVQLYEAATGINLDSSKVRFLGRDRKSVV